MALFVVRVALPDRPGALGAVASRIGSVRGDVVAVEVVEHEAGRAVDEFVVELPDAALLRLLTAEIEEVDGATVEDLRPVESGGPDRHVDAYDNALALLRHRAPDRILSVLASLTQRELAAAWVAVVDGADRCIVAHHGRPPAAPWLASYIVDARVDPPGQAADLAWAELGAWDLMLVAGRPGSRFGPHERRRLEALARLADARWSDLAEHDARTSHPSRAG